MTNSKRSRTFVLRYEQEIGHKLKSRERDALAKVFDDELHSLIQCVDIGKTQAAGLLR